MQPMVNIALRAAREAGLIIARAFDRPDLTRVSRKGINDYVTNIDKDAEHIIVDILRGAYPDHRIKGEEFGEQGESESDTEWIIDPLDGTLNFVQGIPHFCVAICCRQKGRLLHAVILDPMRQEEFTASRGQGCRMNDRRVRVTPKEYLAGAVLALSGSGLDGIADRQASLVRQFYEERSILRQTGSACLDLAYVASGRFDGLWLRNLSVWDMAAGSLMVTEAGGLVSDFDGGGNHLETGQIVAASPRCFRELLPRVRKAFQ